MSGWLARLARRRGYDLIERRYYSPVPDLSELPGDAFERVDPLRGIDLDTAAQMDFAERELAEFIAEFEDPPGFQPWNSYYEPGDAEIAYAFARRFKPRRVVELGSGFSTLVLASAIARNGGDSTYVAFNPYPPDYLQGDPPPGLTEHRSVPAQEVPEAEIEALGEKDILFVDTSHTVKLGGDVNAIVLDLLPLVAPGVLVHFHDIWLPHEYHRVLVEDMQMFWAEQYLLQAFLAFNSEFEIVFATQAVAQAEAERLQRLIPAYEGKNFPSSFWITRSAQP